MKAAARIIEGQCQCGRGIVWIVRGKLRVCGPDGCAQDPAYCTCHPVGLYAGLGAILEDMREER